MCDLELYLTEYALAVGQPILLSVLFYVGLQEYPSHVCVTWYVQNNSQAPVIFLNILKIIYLLSHIISYVS